MKRTRVITFESEKIVIRRELRETNWCEACAASAPMLTVEEAAMLVGEEPELLYRMAECGQIHTTRRSDGVLMTCLRSLSAVPGSEWQTRLKGGAR